jgi:hypothetical protein
MLYILCSSSEEDGKKSFKDSFRRVADEDSEGGWQAAARR